MCSGSIIDGRALEREDRRPKVSRGMSMAVWEHDDDVILRSSQLLGLAGLSLLARPFLNTHHSPVIARPATRVKTLLVIP